MNAANHWKSSALKLVTMACVLSGAVVLASAADAAILSSHLTNFRSFAPNDGNPDTAVSHFSLASGVSGNSAFWESGSRANTNSGRGVRGWGNASVTDAATAVAQEGANEYAFFTIEPSDSEKVLNLDTISAYRARLGGAPDRFSIFAYINDDTTAAGRKIVVDSISVPNSAGSTGNIDLSSTSSFGSTFQGIDKVEFRLIFHGSNLGSNDAVYLDDIVVNGDVVIPEPASLALIGIGTLTLLTPRKRG